jgi:cytochrome oxidase Cu insertion factor (SCO1/SenC/PrrC family)
MTNSPRLMRVVLTGLLAVPALGVLLTALASGWTSKNRITRLPMLGTVPEFALVESGGQPLRSAELQGKIWIASFIFTRCAGTCPIMTSRMARLQERLPVRDDVRLVSVSVDPDHDTPSALAKYATQFHADRNHWLFLTGDKKEIRRLATDVFHLAMEDFGGTTEEPILHSTKAVLVDRNAAIRGYYDSTDVAAMEKLARDVEKLLAERS